MVKTQEITPIKIFKRANGRAEIFISGGKGNKGRRDADDLRAAVVFAVASIDAYFRSKIIYALRKKKSKQSSSFSEPAVKIVQKIIAKRLFSGKEYSQLKQHEKQAVNAMCESGKPYLINYLQEALEDISFQSVDRLDEGMKILGEKPQEIWGKINAKVGGSKRRKPAIGRPKKKKTGPKVDIRIQLRNLFSRRHRIVHDADLSIQGRRSRGKEISISYDTVKKWINSTKAMVEKLDTIIN